MDKQVQMSVGTILMVVLLFLVACGMAVAVMKLLVPTAVAQIASNANLVASVNEVFVPIQDRLTAFDTKIATVEARLDALERRGAPTD